MMYNKIIKCAVLHTDEHCCIVLSNATPGDYEELIEMDNVFYSTHHLKEWRRSIDSKDVAASKNIPGQYQYKYLKVGQQV